MVNLDYFLASPANTAMSGFVSGIALGIAWAYLSLYLENTHPLAGYYLSF